MKKHNETMAEWAADGLVRMGLDLGDKQSSWCATDEGGELREGEVAMTPAAVEAWMAAAPRCRVVLEASSHSHWVAKLLGELGHEAVVVPADAITGARRRRKNDLRDRRLLMELAWDMDRKQVREVWQRPRELQQDLTVVRARDAVKRSRSRLTNAARGLVKPYGERIPKCDADYLPRHARAILSAAVLALVEPLLQGIEALTQQLQQYDRQLATMLARRQEDACRVEQPKGVGLVATSTYLSVIGDPTRFARSRDVPAYVGSVTRQEQSGESDPQLGISKAGDPLLRRVMVQSAQYILGPHGEDSDLRRWGLKLAGDGKNKARKRKAVMAVARKLMVLLHRLWITGETYEPLRNARRRGELDEEAVAA